MLKVIYSKHSSIKGECSPLRQGGGQMLIKDLISRSPLTINYGASLYQAAQIMVREEIGLLPIVDPNNQRKVIGVISERDFVKVFSTNKDLKDLKVENAGTMKNVITIKETDNIAKAAQLMIKHNIRHLIVVDDENNLVGVISIRDIMKIDKILKTIAETF